MLTCTRWLKTESGPHSLPGWYVTPLAASRSPRPTLSTLLDGSLGETRGSWKALREAQVPEELLPRLRSWGLDGSHQAALLPPGGKGCEARGPTESEKQFVTFAASGTWEGKKGSVHTGTKAEPPFL